VFALTYGNEFNGTQGAGFEFGIMLFLLHSFVLRVAIKQRIIRNKTCKYLQIKTLNGTST
jgi:hypothetical protein